MNLLCVIILLVAASTTICEAFFLFKAKAEPIFFCIKVCPLYCSPRKKRAIDHEDIYIDHEPDDYDSFPPWKDFHDDVDWSHSPYYFCKPHPKPTTPKPTTTTEEPTYICQLCKEKCHYPK